jgi:hypothetical protein
MKLVLPMREEVMPKNILMIGPTGVGKTEVARRLAKLAGAPFIKVEATKYTEVGFHGKVMRTRVLAFVVNIYVSCIPFFDSEQRVTWPRTLSGLGWYDVMFGVDSCIYASGRGYYHQGFGGRRHQFAAQQNEGAVESRGQYCS